MKLKKGEQVRVTWRDAASCDNGWEEVEEFNFEALKIASVMQTLGTVIRQDREYIFVAQNARAVMDQCCAVIAIPLGCVIRVKKIG
jgi:hypothetical protein